MSVTRTHTTEMKDQKALVAALKAKGFNPTVLETPEKIRGHYDEKSDEKCEIVCRREDNKRNADIGFSKGADGNYKVVTDTYVNRDLNDLDKFTQGLKVEYSAARAKALAKKNGLQYLGEKKLANGKTRLQFASV